MKKVSVFAVVIAAFLLLLVCVPASAVLLWQIETVDSTGNVGQLSSMVRNNTTGIVHISYHNETNDTLMYARGSGSTTWQKTVIDHVGSGVDVRSSIALDSNGLPHISYYDADVGDLKYASFTGAGWTIQNVADLAGGYTGLYSSLDFTSYNSPRIAYYDWSNGILMYAYPSGAAWNSIIVDNTAAQVGWYTSLAMDSTDRARISYLDYTNGNLKYASWNGSAWVLQTVDHTGKFDVATSLALDGSGNPRIAYYDDVNGRPKYASWNGAAWIKQVVDGSGSAGKYLDLALNSQGAPRISYYKSTPGDLRYASWNGSAWVIETVESAGDVGGDTSLALDNQGYPHISYSAYLGPDNNDLKYAFLGGATTPTITSISPGSGPPGTLVTITGTNFGNTRGAGAGPGTGRTGAGASYVSFNGVRATSYSKWTDTQIVCKVPEGATAGPVTVVVDGMSSSNTVRFGTTTPTWYLAEGTTAWGFGCYVSIENPNTTAVHAAITYMTSSGQVAGGTVSLPAKSQATVNPADVLGQKDFSTKVVCTEGKSIEVDRTMNWTGPGAASSEAHSSVGVTAPATTWYLPEGSSAWGFDCWLLIQNPNSSTATCQVTYMIEDGAPKTVTKTIPANSRQTFNIKDDIGEKDASIKVQSTGGAVIPERAMYRSNRREGHDSIGTTTPASNYYLAEGTTAWGFTTYVLVQNPNAGAANVTVTYMTPSGAKAQAPFSLAANSRKTIRVNDVAGMGSTDFSTQVHGTVPIIAERAMYWNNGTGEACHDSIGMDRAHVTFYLPDGQSSNGCETWTLVQNPNSTAVQVEISYMTPNGQGNVVKTETIPASSRQTFGMLSHSGINGRASIMVTSKTSGKKIMVERAMYWNNRGAGTDTIGGYSD